MAAAPGAVDPERAVMIRPLRRAHLRIWIVMAVALYAVLAGGLWLRRTTTPPNPDLQWEHYR